MQPIESHNANPRFIMQRPTGVNELLNALKKRTFGFTMWDGTPVCERYLATVEFVVLHRDTAGGPGANFLIQWAGAPEIDKPLIEALMVGQSGNAGISFSSPAKSLRDPAPQ